MYRWIFILLLSAANLFAQPLDNRIRSKVFHFVANRVQADSFSVFIQVPQNIPEVSTNGDNLGIHVDWSKGQNALSGRVLLPVRISNGHNLLTTVQVIADVTRFERVCLANGMLDRHHMIGQYDVRYELRDVTNMHEVPIQSMRECVGKRTRRMITGDRILTAGMLQSPPMVERGRSVKVVLSHHNLEITTSGIAKEDGWLGDNIRVRHAQSKQDIYCEVKSDNLVQANM